jgi:hypothetical protein
MKEEMGRKHQGRKRARECPDRKGLPTKEMDALVFDDV